MAKVAEEQRLVPLRARAECLTTARLYLEQVAGSPVGRDAVQLNLIANDLSASGLEDLSFLLENYASGAGADCYLKRAGKLLQAPVADEQACQAWLRQEERDVGLMHDKWTFDYLYIRDRANSALAKLQSCYHGDQIPSGAEGEAEAQWKVACQLAEMTGLSITDVRKPNFAAPPPAVARKPVKVPPATVGPGARITRPEYPSASRRARETGMVAILVHVLADGRPGEMKVTESSGFPRLDEAAMATVREWRFVPGTEDGVPTAMWHGVALTFGR